MSRFRIRARKTVRVIAALFTLVSAAGRAVATDSTLMGSQSIAEPASIVVSGDQYAAVLRAYRNHRIQAERRERREQRLQISVRDEVSAVRR